MLQPKRLCNRRVAAIAYYCLFALFERIPNLDQQIGFARTCILFLGGHHLVDPADQQENDKCQNDEVDYGGNKCAITSIATPASFIAA